MAADTGGLPAAPARSVTSRFTSFLKSWTGGSSSKPNGGTTDSSLSVSSREPAKIRAQPTWQKEHDERITAAIAERDAKRADRRAREAELDAKIKEWTLAALGEEDGGAAAAAAMPGIETEITDAPAGISGGSASEAELCTAPTPRFDAGDPAMVAYLVEHGYAVVTAVASADEVDTAKDLFWQHCEGASGMQRGRPETWDDEFLADPQNGIVSGEFCHSEAAWFARTRPKVRRAFEAVWTAAAAADESAHDGEDLIVSFDGGNLFRPHHRPGKAGWKTRGGWWHVDQGPKKRGLCAVQGLVALSDATEQTGGLCVVPGSHRGHDSLMQYAFADHDFHHIPEPRVNPCVRGRGAKLVTAKAGDLVLWDSRTIHCNTPSVRDPTVAAGHPDVDMLRMVVYVCMVPRGRALAEVLPQRKKAFAHGLGTSHWPEASNMFGFVGDVVSDDELEAAMSTKFADRPWVADCHALL